MGRGREGSGGGEECIRRKWEEEEQGQEGLGGVRLGKGGRKEITRLQFKARMKK